MELSKSLEEGKSDEQLAKDYEQLAKNLTTNKEYAKAEEYYIRAKNIYTKLKDKESLASVERELAKLKETQNQIDEAILNFQSASKNSQRKSHQALNASDAQRLMNQSNSAAQSEIVSQKIEILKAVEVDEMERVEAYRQMAQINLEQNEPEKAISNFELALKETKSTEEEIQIGGEIARIYQDNQQSEKAIEINEKLLEKTKELADPQLKINQLKNISATYFENQEEEKGIESLLKAYHLAIEQNNTLAAKESAQLLADYYKRQKETNNALNTYSDFLDNLAPLLQKDSSLVDSHIFQINEEKILQLEKERILKDKLIKKQNLFSYILIAVIILIVIFLIFIIRALLSIRTRNKKIALQSLRREMNPHFIFNSLNSVNQFIAQNDELQANKYLSSYSKLMRTVMENSNKDFIPLSSELEQMKEYLQLEYMRFPDKFSYSIDVENTIDKDNVLIPNMLIQPQLENAIWHGLRYKTEKGFLLLKIYRENSFLFIHIEDNGIGIEESKRLKTTRQKEHKSRGLLNTYERIELLNNLYKTNIRIEIAEKQTESGVIVTIQVPPL